MTRHTPLVLSPSARLAPRTARPHFRASALSLAIGTSLAMPTVQAQQETEAIADAPVIQVVGEQLGSQAASMKFRRSLLDTAQTVTVVPENLITERAASTLRDVLRNVSGISMQAGEGGTPAGDQLSIRGYSARTDIFVDNVRDFGGYTRDPFNLEQVEVVKGPSSDYSGRGSTGGSINLVSKRARLEDLTLTSVARGSDDYTRVTLDVNRALAGVDDAAFRLAILVHDQDIAGRDEVANHRWGIAPTISFGLETDTTISLSLFRMEQDNVPDYGIPWVPASNVPLADYADSAPPVSYSNWYGLRARDFEEIATSLATVQVDHRFSDAVQFQNISRWGETRRDSLITAPRFLSDASTDIRRSDEKERDQTDGILSNQSNLALTLNPGEHFEHRLLLGAEVTVEDQTRYTQVVTGSDSPPTDLYRPTPGDAYREAYARTGTASTSDSTSYAVYVSDSIAITPKVQLNLGARWDAFALDFAPDGSPELERTDKMLSTRAGLVYKPVPEGSVYLGHGTSFNPTAEALSIATGSRNPGIEDLDPEENRTLELGTKWQVLNRRMLFSAAVFHTEKTNARTQDPTDPNDVLVLKGEQRVRGVELGLAGQLTDRFGAFAGYTYLETEITSSLDLSQIGKSLDNSPRHSFNLWSSYTLSDRIELGLGGQYVDERFTNVANTRSAPAYWVMEATASMEVNEHLGLRVNVQNLTDERYIDFVGGGHFIPGLGRSVLLSASLNF